MKNSPAPIRDTERPRKMMIQPRTKTKDSWNQFGTIWPTILHIGIRWEDRTQKRKDQKTTNLEPRQRSRRTQMTIRTRLSLEWPRNDPARWTSWINLRGWIDTHCINYSLALLEWRNGRKWPMHRAVLMSGRIVPGVSILSWRRLNFSSPSCETTLSWPLSWSMNVCTRCLFDTPFSVVSWCLYNNQQCTRCSILQPQSPRYLRSLYSSTVTTIQSSQFDPMKRKEKRKTPRPRIFYSR